MKLHASGGREFEVNTEYHKVLVIKSRKTATNKEFLVHSSHPKYTVWFLQIKLVTVQTGCPSVVHGNKCVLALFQQQLDSCSIL